MYILLMEHISKFVLNVSMAIISVTETGNEEYHICKNTHVSPHAKGYIGQTNIQISFIPLMNRNFSFIYLNKYLYVCVYFLA